MTQHTANYRLDGIYPQRQEGFFMQRVKLAAGVISAEQARSVATTAERFGQGAIHLTTRGSMEIHWLKESDLPAVKRALAAVGLTSRGACGGAVRGVTCASQGALGFPTVEGMARALHRHFTGNPRFERLPKKFKIGLEADPSSRRHLIQDAGLLLAAEKDGQACFDLYVAGGLGREPQPGFLFEAAVSETRVIPLLEAIARVYAAGAAPGKRLKHLVRAIGEAEFRRLVAQDVGSTEELPPTTGVQDGYAVAGPAGRLISRVPAGQLTSRHLTALADFADRFSGGYLMATADQDIAFHLADGELVAASAALAALELAPAPVNFRVCPGTATCMAGLSATREIADSVADTLAEPARRLDWAISGCPNSCTQPQLADVGIITSGLVKDADGERTPRFDLYRSGEGVFGTLVAEKLTLDQLCRTVQEIR